VYAFNLPLKMNIKSLSVILCRVITCAKEPVAVLSSALLPSDNAENSFLNIAKEIFLDQKKFPFLSRFMLTNSHDQKEHYLSFVTHVKVSHDDMELLRALIIKYIGSCSLAIGAEEPLAVEIYTLYRLNPTSPVLTGYQRRCLKGSKQVTEVESLPRAIDALGACSRYRIERTIAVTNNPPIFSTQCVISGNRKKLFSRTVQQLFFATTHVWDNKITALEIRNEGMDIVLIMEYQYIPLERHAESQEYIRASLIQIYKDVTGIDATTSGMRRVDPSIPRQSPERSQDMKATSGIAIKAKAQIKSTTTSPKIVNDLSVESVESSIEAIVEELSENVAGLSEQNEYISWADEYDTELSTDPDFDLVIEEFAKRLDEAHLEPRTKPRLRIPRSKPLWRPVVLLDNEPADEVFSADETYSSNPFFMGLMLKKCFRGTSSFTQGKRIVILINTSAQDIYSNPELFKVFRISAFQPFSENLFENIILSTTLAVHNFLLMIMI